MIANMSESELQILGEYLCSQHDFPNITIQEEFICASDDSDYPM